MQLFMKLAINLCFSRMLTTLREKFDPVATTFGRKHELTSTNIVDLAQGCCQLAEILKINLLSGIPNPELRKEIDVIGLDMRTFAENNAEKVRF
jgi:hypothetical protein